MINFRRLRRDMIALGLLALAVFLGLSLVSYNPADPPAQTVYPARAAALNIGGSIGAYIAHGMHSAFGFVAYFILFSIITFGIRLFTRPKIVRPYVHTIGWLLLLTSLCIGCQTLAPGMCNGQIVGSGGYLGVWGVTLLETQFATGGILILVLASCSAGTLLTTDLLFVRIVFGCMLVPIRVFNWIAFGTPLILRSSTGDDKVNRCRFLSFRGSQKTFSADENFEIDDEDVEVDDEEVDDEDVDDEDVEVDDEDVEVDDEDVEVDDEDVEIDDGDVDIDVDKLHSAAQPDHIGKPELQLPIKVNPPVTTKSARDEIIERLEATSLRPNEKKFQLPDLNILDAPEDFPYELLAKKARIAAVTLEKTFQEFGLNVRVAEIDTGPVITQFELKLEAGLRLSKVTRLADDLAIALRVPAVRVVAPIPGKNTVGVEVPNAIHVIVRLRELIEARKQDIEDKQIPLFLGKDVSGRPLVVDLTKLPHLLIAGRTGTGKSVCLNSLILSILATRTPDEVKMLLIDPKMVELSPYKRIPHLMHPVITDMKKAEAVLSWAVDKMEERYDLLARCGVRNLDGYNKLGKQKVLQRCGIDPKSDEVENIPDKMPYIVIIADEMADMMMTSGKDVEGHIIRLAQKSRAVGIHLVLATQKPTVDIITGLIKANLPARISFQVASRTDSRVVLDEMGAERLLGTGDMLYLAPATSHLTRAQGTFVSDEEVNKIIDFFSDQDPQYSVELAQLSASSSNGGGADSLRNRDELYDQAIEIVVREGRGSVSLLQRCLGIGYGRAARLIDYMAEDGIVGDYNGSQAREVLYTIEQLETLQWEEECEEVVS